MFIDSSRMLSKEDNKKKVNESRDMMTEVDFLSAKELQTNESPKRDQELSF